MRAINVFPEGKAEIITFTVRRMGENTGRQKQTKIIHSQKQENQVQGSKTSKSN